MFKKSTLNGLILIVGILIPTQGSAQQQEVFHGTPLNNMNGTRILVNATMRSGNVELLRIRATSETAQPFLRIILPPSRPKSEESRYPFVLQVGPPLHTGTSCNQFPDSRIRFEDCISRSQSWNFGSWLAVPLSSDPSPDAIQIAVKSTTLPTTYGRCSLIMKDIYVSKCEIYFEQGGHWHALETSGQALDNIKLFQCAALQLRNIVWPAAPSITDLCGK